MLASKLYSSEERRFVSEFLFLLVRLLEKKRIMEEFENHRPLNRITSEYNCQDEHISFLRNSTGMYIRSRLDAFTASNRQVGKVGGREKREQKVSLDGKKAKVL